MEARRQREELAEKQPQLHITGELLGGSGFDAAVCCKWALEAGAPQGDNLWVLVEGDEAGQTHTDYPAEGSNLAVWGHPIDAHYNAGTLSVRCEVRCPAYRIVRLTRVSHAGLATSAVVCLGTGRRWTTGVAGIWRDARALHTGQL